MSLFYQCFLERPSSPLGSASALRSAGNSRTSRNQGFVCSQVVAPEGNNDACADEFDHGTYCAQQKAPARLQAAVAQVLGNGKLRQAYLKKSLGTKDLKIANVRAKPVLAGFDRVFRDASAIASQAVAPPAKRTSLNAAEIARMSEALYGKLLADDEAFQVRWEILHRKKHPICSTTNLICRLALV